MTNNKIRTRFAPSPTGRMHIGNARSALYPFLLARRMRGTFILRIEDTDQKRYNPGAEQELIEGLRWLGINHDEGPDIGGLFGPYHQTERREIYHEYAWKLVETGHAFPCFCSPETINKIRQEQIKNKENPRYTGTCRKLDPADARRKVSEGEKHVIRFKMPKEGSITAQDLLRGPIVTTNEALDDSVLIKSDGLPTYHLAAMVDDHLMKISHVIRGSEWLPSLPLHAHIIRSFGWQEPIFVHLSVFLKPSGKGKMSKRSSTDAITDGHSIFLGDMKELGYTPEGVLNWIVLMGWGVPDSEILTLDQMIDRFNINNLTPSPASINFQKLDHFNAAHIRTFSTEDLAARIKPYYLREYSIVDDDLLFKIIPLIRERLVTLDDCIPFAGFFFKEKIEPVVSDLIPEDLDIKQSVAIIRQSHELLRQQQIFDHFHTEPLMRGYVEEAGYKPKQVFGIIRVAVTGQKVSPPLFECMEIIGKKKVLERLQYANQVLEKQQSEQ